jgi:DNA-binding transcriptional ArsR family regulator
MLVVDPEIILGLLRHPLRREILKRYIERDERLSPRQLSRELGERLNNVSYHIRVLREADVLILVDKRSVGPAMQHYYIANESLTELPWLPEALKLPKKPENGGGEA